ncbi:MAG: hypothetical protein V4501_06545 [Pseudomonadota bacterium]
MPKFISRMKKISAFIATVAALSIIAIPQLRADTPAPGAGAGSDTLYLQEIATYTNSILTAITTPVNPVVLMILEPLFNLVAVDNSTNPQSPTPALQNSFTTVNFTGEAMSPLMMMSNYAQLQSDFFSNISSGTVPNANDLAFGSLIQQPLFSPDPRQNNAGNIPYNYIKTASGMTMIHVVPGTDWKGSNYDQNNYKIMYNTESAVQTFNGYALSQLYTDTQLQLTTQQAALVAQVSDPKAWFAVITSEPIGAVLRQTLMFQSQSYVLLTQLLQTEKLILAAIAMNNTMAMVNNTGNESMALMKAVKAMPKGSM